MNRSTLRNQMTPNKGTRHTAVKICGLKRQEDVQICRELGADFVGFIFIPHSPRCVQAYAAAQLDSGNAARVGVFANQPLGLVKEIMRLAKLDFAQLHGNEHPDYCRAVGAKQVIKVLWPERFLDQQNNMPAMRAAGLAALQKECDRYADACSWYLLDAGMAGGGSGKQLNHRLLAGFSPARPWLLAGGITPDTVGSLLANCSPDGLDCNSGLESGPGVKDHQKVKQLFRQIAARPFAAESLRIISNGTEIPGDDNE